MIARLFDLHITVQNQHRGFLLPNNVFVKLKGSLELAGTALSKVNDIVGQMSMDACEGSRNRKAELNEGHLNMTRCLTVEVWPEHDCPSLLRLQMEAGKLSAINSLLWPLSGVTSGF
jgi:hypothetical protein